MFYMAGDLEMALKYASPEAESSFRAEYLLSASRHDIVMNRDGEMSEDERRRTKDYLAEALRLFAKRLDKESTDAKRLLNSSADAKRLLNSSAEAKRLLNSSAEAKRLLNSSAEAKLLLGGLSKDGTIVTEAYATFYELHNFIGQIMCMKVLLCQKNDFASCFNCLDCLHKLFDLVESIESMECAQNALQEQQTRQVRSFYGLEAAKEPHMYIVMSGHGARISSLLPTKALHLSTIEEKQAHGYIISDLVGMAADIVAAVRAKARRVLSENRMCEQYSSGLQCEVSGCLHHLPTLKQRWDLILGGMYLVLLNVLIATTLKLNGMENKTPDEVLQDFYEIMFPVDGHVPFVASQLVQIIRGNVRLRSQMIRFTEECVWKCMEHKDRQANTDRLIMIHSVRLVCEPNPENMINLLLREEKWFKEEEARKSRSVPRLGIHKTHDGGLIYFRIYVESAVHLYRKRDPVESFACLNMLLGFTARHPGEPLLPSIANTAMLLEQQLVLAACLNLRFGDSAAVFLPESYLSAVDFRDVLHSSRGTTGGLYDSVDQYAGLRLETKRVDYLVRLMCGCVVGNFDIFTDVFDSDDAIESGVCERVLILVLVMLSNAGLGRPVSVASENLLRKRLAEVCYKNYPGRLASAMEKVSVAKCKSDVVIALIRLLESRDKDEPLRKCVWIPEGRLIGNQTAEKSDICDNHDYESAIPTAVHQTSNVENVNQGAAEEDLEGNPGTDLFFEAYMNQARMDQEKLDEGIALLLLAANDASILAVAPQPQQLMFGPLSEFDKSMMWLLQDIQPMLNEVNAYLDSAIRTSQLSEALHRLTAAWTDVDRYRHSHKLGEMREAAGALRACLGEAKVTMDRIQKEEQQVNTPITYFLFFQFFRSSLITDSSFPWDFPVASMTDDLSSPHRPVHLLAHSQSSTF